MENNDPAQGRITFKGLKGTKVYGADGELFGHIDDLELNRATLNPTHLIIHKGLFGEYLRINLKYIDSLDEDGVKLWISPVKELIGARVLDKNGTEIGLVREAERNPDGDLEYVRVEVRLIEKTNKEDFVETIVIPMMPFEDMSLSLSPMDDGTILPKIRFDTRDVLIRSDDIISLHKGRIVLRKDKEEYLGSHK